MVIIETDILIALASKTDKHHGKVRKILENLTTVKLSPYSLIELDLLITSQSLTVKLPDFYEALEATLAYYGVTVLAPHPAHFEKAWIFRKKYNLTFFDSLHAATAVKENETLVSFDRRYNDVRELKYKHPSVLF